MAESVAGGRNRRVRRFFSHLWPRRLRWRITMLVALAVVIALTVWLILGRGEKSGAAGGTQYRTTTVSAQTLKSSVSASGTLAPLQQESLSFDSSGTVTGVKVGVGATVTKGQTLATIDPSALKVALQTAKADLAAAQDSLDTLEDDSSATSTEISAAEAAVTVKQNAVTEARSNLAGATLTAPFAGVIAAVGISKGDSTGSSGGGGGSDSSSGSTGSSGSGSATTGTTSSSSSGSITLISKGTFTVTTSVSASDVGSVKKGMAATITASGVTSAITGTVTSVGVVASTSDSDSGSSTFPVTVTVAGTHTDLLPGASVTVAITTKQLSNVIAVATDAITTENGSTYVQRLVDGKPTRTKVTIGSVIGQQTVVKSGLKSGDQVIVATFKAAQGSSRSGSGNASGDAGSGGNGGGQMGGGGMGGGSGGGGMPGGSGGGQPGGR